VTELQLDVDLPYPPELVWRALVDRQLLGEWWLPVDLAPQEGESFRAFPPSQTPGLPATLEVDVLRADKPSLLSQRWSGDDLYTQVTWEILPQPTGSRLRFTQQGFFGFDGKQRRVDLRDLYITMLTRRLPEALGRAGGAILAPTTEFPRLVSVTGGEFEDDLADEDLLVAPEPASSRRRRVLLLTATLAVIAALSLAVVIYLDGNKAPADESAADGRQLITNSLSASPVPTGSEGTNAIGTSSAFPAGIPNPTASATISASPESTVSPSGPAPALTATYRTMSVLGLGGFDTEVTVLNPGSAARPTWTVVLVMPDATTVTNKTPGEIDVSQQAEVVTIKPLAGRALPAKGSVTFTIGRPGLIVAGTTKSCSIDTKPCTAG
jgi:uncharacterized protein YndB with AHSA1/START domain